MVLQMNVQISLENSRSSCFIPIDANYATMDSPVGELTVIASLKGLHAILWDNYCQDSKYASIMNQLRRSRANLILIQTQQQLNEYFRGERKIFDVPLLPYGTGFQIQAWQQLLQIPYATTISYKTQAERVGDKNKARAVGMANGRNPISIIVPCHRVVGSNNKLVGFGGGLDKKDYLLKLEKSYIR